MKSCTVHCLYTVLIKLRIILGESLIVICVGEGRRHFTFLSTVAKVLEPALILLLFQSRHSREIFNHCKRMLVIGFHCSNWIFFNSFKHSVGQVRVQSGGTIRHPFHYSWLAPHLAGCMTVQRGASHNHFVPSSRRLIFRSIHSLHDISGFPYRSIGEL